MGADFRGSARYTVMRKVLAGKIGRRLALRLQLDGLSVQRGKILPARTLSLKGDVCSTYC